MKQHHQLRRRKQLGLLQLLHSTTNAGLGLTRDGDDRAEDVLEDVTLGGFAVEKGHDLGQMTSDVSLEG